MCAVGGGWSGQSVSISTEPFFGLLQLVRFAGLLGFSLQSPFGIQIFRNLTVSSTDRYVCALMGANARTGRRVEPQDDRVVGNFRRDELNEHGELLLTFATNDR